MGHETRQGRGLPLAATGLLLAVGGWRIEAAPATPAVRALEAGLVAAAAAVAAITYRLRLGERRAASTAAGLQALMGVLVATGLLVLADLPMPDRVTVSFCAYIAIVLSLNPASPRRVLAGATAAALGGLALVWIRGGLLEDGGAAGLTAACGLTLAVALLAYANWSLTEGHSRRQTERLQSLVETTRRVSMALDLAGVARAALSGCRDAYPQATWGGILVRDPGGLALVSLPAHLGPEGVRESTGVPMRIAAGEGVAGTVLATGRPVLLGTRAEIRAAYANVAPERLRELTRFGGGGGPMSFIACPMRSPDGRATGVLILNSHVRECLWDGDDLTVIQGIADATAVAVERAGLHERQRRQVVTDALTGQGNRRAFEDAIGAHRGQPCAVLAIDVDHLKATNDEYGHEAGDRLLVEVARTLAAQLRPDDLLARVGGDEFVAVLRDVQQPEAEAAAERMRRSLYGVALPHGVARVSIGVVAGGRGCDLRTLWNAADAALAAAKRGGRDRVVQTDTSAALRAAHRSQDVARLLDELFAGTVQVRPVFQPIVRLGDGAIAGYEALARMPSVRDEGLGVEDFFAAAHRLGAMRDLDWLCRRAAIEQSSHLQPQLPLFVNVSVAALLDPVHPVDQMLLLTRSAGRAPWSVVLEITERELIADKRRLRLVLASYREHGFRFALDDVGEGHSTLEVLAAAMPEFIKLAPSMTATIGDEGSAAAIDAAVAFARRAGRGAVIAEGIEDRATARLVAASGIELGQGYWFAGPSRTARRGPLGAADPETTARRAC